MTNSTGWLFLLVLLATSNYPCVCQPERPIRWTTNSRLVNAYETELCFTAQLAPGWHLYSQSIKEGGPTPTEFVFEKKSSFVLIGSTLERGDPVKYYDELFEMDIIWYANTVSFYQRVYWKEPLAIKGKVLFMVCNSSVCVPDEYPFSIAISP